MSKINKTPTCRKCSIEKPRSSYSISEATGQILKVCDDCRVDNPARKYGYLKCGRCKVPLTIDKYSKRMFLRKSNKICMKCESLPTRRHNNICTRNAPPENKYLDIKVGGYLKKLPLLSPEALLFWDIYNAA